MSIALRQEFHRKKKKGQLVCSTASQTDTNQSLKPCSAYAHGVMLYLLGIPFLVETVDLQQIHEVWVGFPFFSVVVRLV